MGTENGVRQETDRRLAGHTKAGRKGESKVRQPPGCKTASHPPNGSLTEDEHDETVVEEAMKIKDKMRKDTWHGLLAGMLLYPSGVVFSLLVGLDQAAKILGDMAAVYYVSVAAIVAAYFGTQALKKK